MILPKPPAPDVSELHGILALVRPQQLRSLSHAHVRDWPMFFLFVRWSLARIYALLSDNRCARRTSRIRGRTVLFRSAESRVAVKLVRRSDQKSNHKP